MSWLGVEASFGSGATTGLDPSISFSRLSLSKIRKDLSQRELYFFASLVLFYSVPTSLVALLILLVSFIAGYSNRPPHGPHGGPVSAHTEFFVRDNYLTAKNLTSRTSSQMAPVASTSQNAARLMPTPLTIRSDPKASSSRTAMARARIPAAKISSERMAITRYLRFRAEKFSCGQRGCPHSFEVDP